MENEMTTPSTGSIGEDIETTGKHLDEVEEAFEALLNRLDLVLIPALTESPKLATLESLAAGDQPISRHRAEINLIKARLSRLTWRIQDLISRVDA